MAVVAGRPTLKLRSPRPSVRLESIGPPAPPIVTRCSTTQARGSGRPFGPPCMTRPVTTTRCARISPPAPLSRQARARALGSELPEVFRIEVLQVGLELVGAERRGTGLGAGLACLDRSERQQVLGREDGSLEPQRDGDGIRRSRVHLNHGVAAVDVELGVVGVVLHLRDDHLAEVRAQTEDDLLQEVVRERSRELDAGELHRDGARLRRPDPDREHALPLLLLEDHHRRVGGAVEPQMRDPDLDHVRRQVPISHDTRYFFCSGVSVSMVTPMACSLRRAISASSSRGMRCTSFVRRCACCTTNSAASAWFANDMSITLAGWPSAAARLMRRPSARMNNRLPPSRHSSTNSRTAFGPSAAFLRPSRSISTLKCPEFASIAPSFIAP